VGAPGDDGGGSVLGNQGAVWVLFMNADGTMKTHQKISDPKSIILNPADGFGTSVAGLGDLDGDGVRNLGVGAVGDAAAVSGFLGNLGAMWVLFLAPS